MLLDTNAISAIGEKDEAIMGILAEAEAIMLPFAAIAEFRFGLLGSRGSDFHAPGESRCEIGRVGALPEDIVPVWEAFA